MISLNIIDPLVFCSKPFVFPLLNKLQLCMLITRNSVVSFHNSHVSFCCLLTAALPLHSVVTYAGLVEGDRYDLPVQTTGQPAITTRDCQEKAGQANLRDYVNRKFCNNNNWK